MLLITVNDVISYDINIQRLKVSLIDYDIVIKIMKILKFKTLNVEPC